MATTKLTLDMGAMQDDFFADTAMIGIVTAMQGYHFCWMANNHFEIDLVRDPEQDVFLQKKDNEFYFPVYRYELPNSSHKYLLYKLKSGTEPLLPETKQLDYLWLIQTANALADAYRIAAELKNIPDIQLARILSVEELKNVKNLIV